MELIEGKRLPGKKISHTSLIWNMPEATGGVGLSGKQRVKRKKPQSFGRG